MATVTSGNKKTIHLGDDHVATLRLALGLRIENLKFEITNYHPTATGYSVDALLEQLARSEAVLEMVAA